MFCSFDLLSLPECGQAENLKPWHLLPTYCAAITSRETYKVNPPSIPLRHFFTSTSSPQPQYAPTHLTLCKRIPMVLAACPLGGDR